MSGNSIEQTNNNNGSVEAHRVSSIVATVSVTFIGADEQPLTAMRIKVDGKEVEGLPVVMVVGHPSDGPIVIASTKHPLDQLQMSMALSKVSSDLIGAILKNAQIEGAPGEAAPGSTSTSQETSS